MYCVLGTMVIVHCTVYIIVVNVQYILYQSDTTLIKREGGYAGLGVYERRLSFTKCAFSLGPAHRPGQVMVWMCLCVCVCVCLLVPSPEAWTFRYLFDTLDR